MELIFISGIGLAVFGLALFRLIVGHAAAKKIVEQQHLLASDELISDVLQTATNEGKLHQARELFDEARQKQSDGTIRIGHLAWMMLRLDGMTDGAPPSY